MGCPGRKPLFFFLLFVLMYLPGALLQEAGPVRQRKPFFERLRRLEEQFQRFQEAALTHLQGIASNYNLSFDFEARFQSLAHRSQAVALALNQSQATMQEDLGHLKTWMRKTQRRSWKVDSRLLALDTALSERSRQCARERKEQEAQRDALSSLALDVWALQDALAHLMPLVQSQGARLATLEGQLQVASPGTAAPGVTPAQPRSSSPSSPQLQRGRQALGAPPEPREPPLDFIRPLQGTHKLPGPGSQRARTPESPGERLWGDDTALHPPSPTPEERNHPGDSLSASQATQGAHLQAVSAHSELAITLSSANRIPGSPQPSTAGNLCRAPASAGTPWGLCPPMEAPQFCFSISDLLWVTLWYRLSFLPPFLVCNVGPVLVFPNASTKNVVFLCPGFLTSLRALSICSWIRTASGHLGTLLSYATEENDNKLVLHGRDSLVPGSIHFVIGDPAFRELPLQLLLDGRWHHVCVIWTSILGRYWLHVDRRLVATGSRFREGYEIPPRGSLVLGQEQDNVGGGFDSSEAFVGSMAGLAIWDRVLVPGEVSNLATGKELPMGAILTLTSAISVGGFVQRVNCSCLQLCP
ncbi:LOW QUALITY PROTEIN: pentraxin-4 [Camelus ferus]|uniref:LOW QUALITY PROTEIN: pentraxin-4 n=1 Tax=Camelus ferus TaxID=419612 RepID=A0A8B8RIL7_CAMFR|nr:LOW QUALITY PROTEIN: pentraxin-4 [Camelus ferus]